MVNAYKLAEKVAKDYGKERAYRQNKRFIAQEEKSKRYSQSRTGKFSRFVSKSIGFVKSPASSTYSRQVSPVYRNRVSQPRAVRGISTGRRGRPRGTFDSRYARFGGVYGYRKYLSTQLRIQRMEVMRRATINPRQQQVLNRIEEQDRYNQQNPEGKVIPNTSGRTPMSGYMQEIQDAANLVQ